MRKFTFYLFAFICMILTSCGGSDGDPIVNNDNDNDTDIPVHNETCKVTIKCMPPKEFRDGKIYNAVLNIKDINTGKKYEFRQEANSDVMYADLKIGLYEASVKASMNCFIDNKKVTYKVNGLIQSLEVKENKVYKDMQMFIEYDKSEFVLAEIFFAGTLTPEGGQYYADKYFVIYNNSDKLLYADSLAIAESKFLTVTKENYKPNIMDKAMAIQALYMIPGNGKSHPVKPGGKIIICDNALNHLNANPNSFDLTKADYEWADISSNPNISDVNNPDVPDLEKIYCSTKTIWSPHNRGFTSFALVGMGTDFDDYISNYIYNYDYVMVTPKGDFPMSGNCYKIPNSWIVDAVNLSVQSLFKWIVVHPSLDRGWTHCGVIDHDQSRYGKCVRRKVESRREDGTAVLKDTNNSTEDFDADQTADPYYKF